MTIATFIVLSAANLGLITLIIRRRGIASAEGLCLAYLGAAALSDNIALVFHYIVSPESLPLGYREFGFRLYPTAVEILGLAILLVALQTSNGHARPIARDLCDSEFAILRHLGLAVASIGLGLALAGLYFVHAFSSSAFYSALNEFRSQTLPFGGFWYRGADIAVFGLALVLPTLESRRKTLFLTVVVMMLIAFFLRTNKGGLEEPFIWGAIIMFVYNRSLLKNLLSFKTVAFAILIAFFGIGAKFWILPHASRSQGPPLTVAQVTANAIAAASLRWGDNGLYRGYCQFIHMLPNNRAQFRGAKVGVYSLVSWVPRFIYFDKPDHPFRGLGFMIYSDFHSFPDETPAPMLIGSAMADNGFVSLVTYMALAGIFLGFFRRVATKGSSSIYTHSGYMLFVLFGGFSAEEGILGILYTTVLAYAVIAAARLVLFALNLLSVRAPALPITMAPGNEDLKVSAQPN